MTRAWMLQPRHLMLSPRCALATLALLAMACGPTDVSGFGDPGRADEGSGDPIRVKTPPAVKEGTATVEGCMGITQRGTCQDGVAVYCDLERAAVRRNDCAAKGRDCVVKSDRGAICVDDGPEITSNGFCIPDQNIAAYKDNSGVPILDNCSDRGLVCHEDKCRAGAYCCAADGGEPDGPSIGGGGGCQGYDLAGECVNGVATYCLGGELVRDQCSGGQSCQMDVCGIGAYCCGKTTTQDECSQVNGIFGRCDGGAVKWCGNDGKVVTEHCTGGDTCQENTCYASGAACCDSQSAGSGSCGGVTYEGECSGDVLRYCDAGNLVQVDCAQGTPRRRCDRASNGLAMCVENALSECEQIGFAGVCQGNVVHYCSFSGQITDLDCSATGRVCRPYGCDGGSEPQAVCCDR